MAAATKRTLKTRTYEEKLKIIDYAEKHPNIKKKDIAIHFDISPKTLGDIIKNKEKIKETCANVSTSAKRSRINAHPEVDKALLIWFKCRPDMRVDGNMLLRKANEFRLQFESESLDEISPAWIDRFKKRYGIAQKAVESCGLDIREWKKFHEVLNSYHAKDIYNADETSMFWRLFPDNSSHHKFRITVLVGSNMDATDKLPLYVVGKPRASKNVNLPVEYVGNKKAWMTQSLFDSWLRKLDRRMALENRNIALIIDNCPAHPHIELSNIELIFTTSHAQPMDFGIIKNLKSHYRGILAARRLQATEEPFRWNILDSLIALKSAWKSVKKETIIDCYRKAGFFHEANVVDEIEEVTDATGEFRNTWGRLRDAYSDAVPSDPDSYVSVDDEEETMSELNDDQIVDIVLNPSIEAISGSGDDEVEEEEEEDEDEEGEEIPVPVPKLSEAFSALRVLRYYGLRACPEMEDVADQIEAVLMKQSQLKRPYE